MFFFLEALFVSETGSDLTYLGYFLGSPMIDLEVMGLRLTAPAEIRSATPTRQHVYVLFRSEDISISCSPDRDLLRNSMAQSIFGVALRMAGEGVQQAYVAISIHQYCILWKRSSTLRDVMT